jgi:hypothetical protein
MMYNDDTNDANNSTFIAQNCDINSKKIYESAPIIIDSSLIQMPSQ